jgi:hypothetical protein
MAASREECEFSPIKCGSVWTQQGSKLVGTGAVGTAVQGWSVAPSRSSCAARICCKVSFVIDLLPSITAKVSQGG